MRKIIISIVILLSSLIVEIRADQPSANDVAGNENTQYSNELSETIKFWHKGAATNGLICGLYFNRYENEKLLICYVNIINTTTNFFYGCLHLPLEALLKIELYDSQGKPVEKTVAGKRYVVWTQKQIRGWADEMSRRGRGGFVMGSFFTLGYGSFSIPQIFQLKHAGEYTLRLQMRLIQVKQDVSPKIYYETTWLPEVVAKIQILPDDIAPINSVLNGQTNSPAK